MKYSLLLLSPLLLLSCASQANPEMTRQIQNLEQEITLLRTENINLKTENNLCKTWWIQTIGEKSWTSWLESIEPEAVKWSFAGCIQKAHEIYIAQSAEYCKKVGYTPEDIAMDKCRLKNTIKEKLKTINNKSEDECYNIYK